ncbi:LysM peptidoglycan-binding domain-containing protein [Fictibacillus nanhaiensis]|uniref:M14 family metallopeptidase n=1 Tax=Fictibacillus nanhaiensis TaxID=742169 RepID=UPI001C98B670|nr:M14 family metallopeptidase [Fictibacillus nanhaiensis]MBY6035508.1 LysM peptidoglycan-binding domain-containing protein [Fictibacillus nanhaiensis]
MEIIVRNGDSLWYYSRLLSIPFILIRDANPEVMPGNMEAGQKIKIPGITANRYKVKNGDSFFVIAEKNDVPIDALYLFNPGVNPKEIFLNDEILIPVNVSYPLLKTKCRYDTTVLVKDIKKLLDTYPFIKKQNIGQSVLGNPIDMLIIGNGKKKVHINASFHGNEWITTGILMKFLNEYAHALTRDTPLNGESPLNLYKDTTLLAVPMVDPDGVDLVLNGPPDHTEYKELVMELNKGSKDFSAWKANIRGVDLNNQFPARWEIEQKRKPKEPAPRDYPGLKPLSEPEAVAMAEAANKYNFDRVVALHTQGKELYWGFEGEEPMPISQHIAEEFERVSGYKAIRYVDSYAGYKDWFIQEYQRPGFTIELGIGVNPLPLGQFDEIYKDTRGILFASLYK